MGIIEVADKLAEEHKKNQDFYNKLTQEQMKYFLEHQEEIYRDYVKPSLEQKEDEATKQDLKDYLTMVEQLLEYDKDFKEYFIRAVVELYYDADYNFKQAGVNPVDEKKQDIICEWNEVVRILDGLVDYLGLEW